MQINKNNNYYNKQARVTKQSYRMELLDKCNKELINYYWIKSWLQILRFFVAEWALKHNHVLFPLLRAISHENVF